MLSLHFNVRLALALFVLASIQTHASPVLSRREGACSSYLIIDTRGTGEVQGESSGFTAINTAVMAKVAGGTLYNTVYPCFHTDQHGRNGRYREQGDGCRCNSCVVLQGYSQGAAATVYAMPKLTGTAFSAVVAVVLVGNPMHKPGLACNVDSNGGTTTAAATGVQEPLGSIPAAWVSKTLDICAAADEVCGSGFGMGHMSYPTDNSVHTMSENFIVKALQGGSSSVSSTCPTSTVAKRGIIVNYLLKRLMGGLGGISGLMGGSGGAGTTANTAATTNNCATAAANTGTQALASNVATPASSTGAKTGASTGAIAGTGTGTGAGITGGGISGLLGGIKLRAYDDTKRGMDEKSSSNFFPKRLRKRLMGTGAMPDMSALTSTAGGDTGGSGGAAAIAPMAQYMAGIMQGAGTGFTNPFSALTSGSGTSGTAADPLSALTGGSGASTSSPLSALTGGGSGGGISGALSALGSGTGGGGTGAGTTSPATTVGTTAGTTAGASAGTAAGVSAGTAANTTSTGVARRREGNDDADDGAANAESFKRFHLQAKKMVHKRRVSSH